MGRTREWKKRLSRSQWFAAYRAQRDSLFYGAGTSEIIWLTRRGKPRPVRVELHPYSSKYGGDSECLTRFDLNFTDEITPVLKKFQREISRLQDDFASVLDGVKVNSGSERGSFAAAQVHASMVEYPCPETGDPEDA